jgi:hypothetical protein
MMHRSLIVLPSPDVRTFLSSVRLWLFRWYHERFVVGDRPLIDL